MYSYLKDKIYYTDLYDRLTVERCRRFEKTHLESKAPRKLGDKELTEAEAEEVKAKWGKVVLDVGLYFMCGEEYEQKESTINTWMSNDRAKDQKLENAKEPSGVRCLSCGSQMHVESKHLRERKGSEEAFFLFRCNNDCMKGRAFFEDGEEWIPKPQLCSKCNATVSHSDERNGDIITTTYACSSCGHTYTDILDLSIEEKKPDPDFIKDRERFCFDDKRGSEYMSSKSHMVQFGKTMEEIEERDKNKELYEKIAKIKKLPVAEVFKVLFEALLSEKFTNLQFDKPEMGKDLIVAFTVMEEYANRVGRDSEQALKKAITSALEGSNWRLMSDGVTYRAGYLSGRLRCLEREEDLIKLIKF